MGTKTLFVCGVFVTILALFCARNSDAFPFGSGMEIDLDSKLTTGNLTRMEREIDLRQNLHKHIKPFVALSSANSKRPKPVETPVSPYFVRILKRRPGLSSKESSEDSNPKVLIDRRRNKEAPIHPVVVVDSKGIPQRNRTVLIEKSSEVNDIMNHFSQENIEDESRSNPSPMAEALQSFSEMQELYSTETPTLHSTSPSQTTVIPTSASMTSDHTTTTFPVTNPPFTRSSPLIPIVETVVSTSEINKTPGPIIFVSERDGYQKTTKIKSNTITYENNDQSTTLPMSIQISSNIDKDSALPISTTTELPASSKVPILIFEPKLRLQGPLSPVEFLIPNYPEISNPNDPPEQEEQKHVPIFSISNTPEFNSHQTSTPHSVDMDNLPSFSTLAVTTLLPNGEKSTRVTQQEEVMQASEIFSQQVLPATTPISVTTTTNDDLTTVKPVLEQKNETLSPSPSSSISNAQIQHLMKAALARLLTQQGSSSPNSAGLPILSNKLPEISIPHQIRLVNNKPKTEEVVFSSQPGPSSYDLVAKPTSPIPSLLNALQSLIPSQQRNGESNFFSFNSHTNPFSKLFSTPVTNNYDILRTIKTTTAPPYFFINLRDKTTDVPRQTSYSEVVTTKIPIFNTPGSTWEEFNGRENNNQKAAPSIGLGDIIMAPMHFMGMMFKGALSLGQFMGNTINTLANAFNPNKNRI